MFIVYGYGYRLFVVEYFYSYIPIVIAVEDELEITRHRRETEILPNQMIILGVINLVGTILYLHKV